MANLFVRTRPLRRSLAAVVLGIVGTAAGPSAQAPDGARVFEDRCATCHNGAPDSRAPDREVLRTRAPEAVVESLVNGAMRVPGARMTGAERRAVAEFLSGRRLGGDVSGATAGRCTGGASFPAAALEPMWNGWSPTPTNTRFQRADQAGLTVTDLPRLTLKWAFGFPDASLAWAQPTVAGGRVFVGSQNGTVYALDARTGCIYWTFSAGGGVRTAVSVGRRAGAPGHAVFFADTAANAYALDAETGERLWVRKIDEHPLARITAAPTLYSNRLYVGVSSYEESQGADPQYGCCTFRGSLSALDLDTGDVVWRTFMIPDEPAPRGTSSAGVGLWGPSGAGIWSSPTIDVRRGAVYVATGNAYSGPAPASSDAVVALDLGTGAVRWRRQVTPGDVYVSGCRPGSGNPNCPDPNGPDLDFGSSPMLVTSSGRDLVVIGQKSGVGFAMDPDRGGEIVWQYRAGRGGLLGGIEWGAAADDARAYFAVSDVISPQPGGLHAVDLATGEPVWVAPPAPLVCSGGRGCNAAQSAAITVIPGAVLSGAFDGGLRAYAAEDGAIAWAFDTNREFETVNGVPANGASIGGPGPTVAGRMVYAGSGYGAFGGRAGNVLLAFGID